MNNLFKHSKPPTYVPPMTIEQMHTRVARIIYMHPGGKPQADAAADAVIHMLKREGMLR